MRQYAQQARFYIVMAAAVCILVAAGSALYVSRAEEENRFCTSCHLPQEEEYVQRAAEATAAAIPDLATAHWVRKGINCVGCHRGDQSLPQRVASLGLGAANTVKWLLGNRGAHGNVTVRWLPENACWLCHRAEVEAPGFENHLHNRLQTYNALPQVRRGAANAILCDDCHQTHRENEQLLGFLSEPVVIAECDRCHQTWGKGPRGLR
ncbi:MAG: hypothetical protein IT330_01370 [Anaerolineae bacterium]|nr:hypothetical protein [Anaerolineae bacterium]